MFKNLIKIFNFRDEKEKLEANINNLKFELRYVLSLLEKYLSFMSEKDKIQLFKIRKKLDYK